MKGTIMNYVVCFLLITIVKAFDPEVYLKTRGQLVGEEYDASLSGNITMNPKEVMANEILTSLLVKEAAIMGDYFAPSMNFFQAHGWIDNTSILFPLIKQMPKGVIHHLHSDSSASYGWLVSNLTYSPYCYIFQGQSEEYASGSLSMFKSPPSSDWISVNELRNKSGNTEQFDFNLLRSLTMENQDFGDYNQLWNKFDGIFGRLRGLLYYKDAYEGYLQHMVTEMLNDNVQNIELKLATTLTLYDLDNNVYDLDYIITFVSNLINQTREIEPAFTMKLIMANLRRFNETTIFPLLEKSLYYRNKYPDIVVGFDLDGPEDDGFSLLYFLDDFSAIANISANYTYDLPYYFHAGETLMANNTNLYDAVLLGSYRIGHAFQLAKHQGLTEMVKQQNIGLEICPISNQILQYIFDIRGHPALEYFNRGLLMTISPDDPALYGYGGVSYDWYEVLLAWSLDIPGLKQLAINSYIKGSFFNEEERMNSYNAWQTQWNAWIDWILKGYAYSNL